MFRKGLVVFQFMLSIVIITGTIVVSRQVNCLQRVNLGYDRENLLYIPIEGTFTSKYSTFKEAGLNAAGVKMISRLGETPTSVKSATFGVEWDGKTPNTNTAPQFTNTAVGHDFVKTMDLKLIDGREYSKNFASDSTGYLINESALKIIGYKDPIGKPLTF